MPRFAANLSLLFCERPLLERPAAAAAQGFKAIELLFPYDTPADAMRRQIDAHNLTMLGVNTGLGGDGLFGMGALPKRERDFDRLFTQALDYVVALGGTSIHCLAGVVDDKDRVEAERTFVANLSRAADVAAEKSITLLIEPINSRSRPGYFLNRCDQAADILAKVGKPNVRIQFDFYHTQIMEGDALRVFARHQPLIGHVQFAGVPQRNEPDTGELSYPEVFQRLDELQYDGWVAAEYHPCGRTEDGLSWLKATQLL